MSPAAMRSLNRLSITTFINWHLGRGGPRGQNGFGRNTRLTSGKSGLACRPEPHRRMVRGDVFPEVIHGAVYSVVCGLDIHKDPIAVAHAAGGGAEPPVFVGAIGPRQADPDRLIHGW